VAVVWEAAELMTTWAEPIRRKESLHFVASIRQAFDIGGGVWPFSFALGPMRVEAWFRRPLARLEGNYVDRKWVAVLGHASNHIYLLSLDSRWVKKEPLARIDPEALKLSFFGLDLLNAVTYVSLEERKEAGVSVWVVEGLVVWENGEYGCTWWVGQDDRMVKRFARHRGSFEFDYGGEKKKVPLPVSSVIEFHAVEFPDDLPSELFLVPPDAPLEKEGMVEQVLKWLYQWATSGGRCPGNCPS
jgi:hypothetical protein